MRQKRLYRLARHGRIPAEELDHDARHRLVGELVALGWSTRQIAEHCRMTEYTTIRIRRALDQAGNERSGPCPTTTSR